VPVGAGTLPVTGVPVRRMHVVARCAWQVYNEFNARSIGHKLNVWGGLHKNPIFMGIILITIGAQIFIVEVRIGAEALQYCCYYWKHHDAVGLLILLDLYKLECLHVRRGLALPRESLRRDRPGELTSPAFHAVAAPILFAQTVVTVAKYYAAVPAL
jgi:hypothetical protein